MLSLFIGDCSRVAAHVLRKTDGFRHATIILNALAKQTRNKALGQKPPLSQGSSTDIVALLLFMKLCQGQNDNMP